jgi:hypothetical protein
MHSREALRGGSRGVRFAKDRLSNSFKGVIAAMSLGDREARNES